jgi:hypothetical protein
MADRIPTYIDTLTKRISEIAVGDGIDVTGGTVKADSVEVTNLTVGGEAYAPYNDAAIKADISANTAAIETKLDADKIWTGTEAQYNSTSKDADTLYFITG